MPAQSLPLRRASIAHQRCQPPSAAVPDEVEVEERALLKELGERLMVIVVNPNLN